MTTPTPFPTSDAREMARELARLRQRVEVLERGSRTSQLSHSSIENGAIEGYDATGLLRTTIGRQVDGTFAVAYANGSKPPTPTDPEVTAAQLALVVYWHGTFRGSVARPSDVRGVDIHIAPDSEAPAGVFTPGPTTLYASLTGEGAATIPLDNSTYWVKLVAVTNADVASDATAAVQGNPAAARQIAAHAIGAEQLAAQIILATRIVAGGTTDAQRFEIDGDGIRGYNANNEITIFQNPDTGTLEFRGTVSSGGPTDPRIVINDPNTSEGFKAINFYGVGGVEHATIESYASFDSPSVGVSLKSSEASPTPGTDNRMTYLHLAPGESRWGMLETATSRDVSTTQYVRNGIYHAAPYHEVIINADHFDPPVGATHAFRISKWKWNGSAYVFDNALLQFTPSTLNNRLMLNAPQEDWSIKPEGGVGYVINNTDGGALSDRRDLAVRTLFYGTLTSTSDTSSKEDIRGLDFSATQVILSAPVKSWKYQGIDGKHIGPMADDMPDEVQGQPDPTTGHKTIDVTSMLGVMWQSLRELAEHLDIQVDESKLPASRRKIKKGK